MRIVTNGTDAAAVIQHLERVLSSPGFARNERMSRFLRFLVERHIEGRDAELKESLIGMEVFGRIAGYDPKQDSIVRTEAARLRTRLTEYYAGEGRADAIRIELPKGGYVPSFHRTDGSTEPVRGPRWRMTWAVAIGMVVAASAGWWSIRGERTPIPIAVLPLESLSPNSDDAYFADGLTEEITRNLSAIEGLAVRSRTSAFAFKNAPRNVREAGRQLNIDYLVEGSVLRDGGQLRVNAQLIRVHDDRPVWTGRFERRVTDVFAIQDEISRSIVNELRLNLGRGRWRYETSLAAYDIYLRAKRERWGSFQDFLHSIDLFEQAISVDPNFAPAHAGLGAAYAIRSTQFGIEHPGDELDRMRSAAERAVQLDPLLAESHAALALSYARLGEWARSERSFRQAIEMDPSASHIRADFAMWLLQVVGRSDDALEQLLAAQRSDPLASDIQMSLGWHLISLGRHGEAVRHCEAIDERSPFKAQCLGRVRLAQGKLEEAVAIFSGAPDLATNAQARGLLGYAFARSGRQHDVDALLAAATQPNEQALTYAGLRDTDMTLDALARMSVTGPQRPGRYLALPELAFLDGDPRVRELRTRIGLP